MVIIDQREMIKIFCNNSEYFLIKKKTDEEHFGKIIDGIEFFTIELDNNEIYRDIRNRNGDILFVFNLKPTNNVIIDNSLEMIIESINSARVIEKVYPNIFRWCFDGTYVKALAIVPSGYPLLQGIFSRYGGFKNFIWELKKHLITVANTKGRRKTFPSIFEHEEVKEVLSIGSITKVGCYNKLININDAYMKIIKDSFVPKFENLPLRSLDMSFWVREINPDFVGEEKVIKLKNPLSLNLGYSIYPLPIRRIMELHNKGNYNRYLLARFLLSVHRPSDAKFVYLSVLGDEEREHVSKGNCESQWGYIVNNMEKYGCPSLKDVSEFIEPGDPKISHLLEPMLKYMEKND